MDETALTQDPYLCKCWAKKGTQPQVPAAAGLHWTLHVFGGLNVMDGTICYTLADARTSDSFVVWLEQLMTVTYPTQNVCVVLDNASFHRSALSRAAMEHFAPRLEPIFLPPYCPQLNPIEGYWQPFKKRVGGNRLNSSREETQERALNALAHQNDLQATGRYQVCNE